jgi:hypothetical protein
MDSNGYSFRRSPIPLTSILRRRWPLLLFAVLTCLFLWRALFAGEVFVPARLLRYLAPWSAAYPPENRPPWNPLMYDSVGQFYPWRSFAAETLRAGTIPLWNPYQFCGTPFVANSQSAALYPGNLLYWLLPPARAAGWSVALHLLLAAVFMALFLRRLGAGRAACALGGLAFAFSTWQTAWLHLPTFLCTSCWLPLVLLLTIKLFDTPPAPPLHKEGTNEHPLLAREGEGGGPHSPSLRRRGPGGGWRSPIPLGFAVGMTLLAGHLQVAFYVLLAAGLLTPWLARARWKERGASSALRGLGLFAAAVALGGMLAAPQLLPALELSRRSHRVGPPTAQGYAAYTNYAVNPNALATLFLPDFYGNPSNPETPYFGMSRGGMYFNYAEGALYIGLPTLLLAAYALLRRRQPGRLLPFFGGLALLALLMAFGTAVDALFYFYVPGFGQSGSPGRALVLWAFAVSALAGLGYDKLANDDATPVRTALTGILVVAAIAGIAYALNIGMIQNLMSDSVLTPAQWNPQIPRQTALFVLSAGAVLAMAAGKARRGWVAALPLLLLAADLFANNADYNPTAAPDEVYPVTPVIAYLKERAGHDRIMPVNRDGFSFSGPDAVLPPNGAMVFRLRDVGGYDSLFPGQYKAFMNRLAGEGRDASPPEVGNMVFAKNPGSPLVPQTGARFLVSKEPLNLPAARETALDGLYLYELTTAPGRAFLEDAGTRGRGDGARGRGGEGATPSPHHPITPSPNDPITWLEDGPTRVTLAVNAPAPSALVLADQFYPGWRATVDGAPAPVERANGIFRRVHVPPGRHTVTFAYRPAAFRIGLYLMLLAAAVGGFRLGARK